MKSRRNLNPIIRIFALVTAIVFLAIIVAISLFYYIFSIPKPEGLSLASWPNRFTDNFSSSLEYENGTVNVSEFGLRKLDEYGLWIQILDEAGQEIFSYRKPESYPISYSAPELISLEIGNISLRTYQHLKEKGAFTSIYKALNELNMEIRRSDKVKEDTDRVRGEWITNITHDLKTPLSPVKGYAELLAEGSATDNQIAQEVRLIRYLKELVIDVVNDPTFSDRNIEFESCIPDFYVSINFNLFRRAVQNIMINALVHNPPDTRVTISVVSEIENGVRIFIRDNGIGMSSSEQADIFTRYYRKTNTKEKPEGSGLGLAIAKQIIMLHGGDIVVKSSLGKGTEFVIHLPKVILRYRKVRDKMGLSSHSFR